MFVLQTADSTRLDNTSYSSYFVNGNQETKKIILVFGEILSQNGIPVSAIYLLVNIY